MNKIIIEIPAEMANEVLPYIRLGMDSKMEMEATEAVRQIQEQGYKVDINRIPNQEELERSLAYMAVAMKAEDIHKMGSKTVAKESEEPDMRLQHEYQLP